MSYDPWGFLTDPQSQQQTYTQPQPVYQDWYDAPLPQQQHQYQPAPQYSSNDPWAFAYDQAADYQYPPAQQQQQAPTDPFSVVNNFLGNAAQQVDQKTGYFDNVWQAVADPWEKPATATNPFEWIGDNVSRAASSFLGASGAAIQPVGGIVDDLADSNVPIVDPLATVTRGVYENVAEPFFNATPALLGTLAESVDTGGSVNPFDWKYDRTAARRGWDENDPNQVYERTYAEQIGAGKTEEEARARADRDRLKMSNPLNRAFKSGAEEFSTFNPVAQLAVGVVDPVQNVAGKYIFGKPLEAVGKGIGKAADATGIPEAVSKRLESPQQFDATIARENYFAEQHLAEAEAALPDTVPEPQRPYVARQEVFENPDSEFYWEKAGIDPRVAEQGQYFLQAERQANAPVDSVQTPQEAKVAPTESQFAQQLQDTNPPKPGEVQDPFSLPEDTGNRPPNPNELDEFFPQSTKATAQPERTPVDIPDYVKNVIGIPAREAAHGDFLSAVQQKLGYERSTPAYKLAGPEGKKQYLVPTKPLEQFGTAGKVIGALNFTLPFMSRAYLNSSGRAVRDTAGNLAKYVAEGFGFDRSTNSRFERITGSPLTAPLGRASIAAEVGKEAGKGNLATAAFYHVINPFNEVTSDILRAVTKGKYKNWNDLTEANETGLKTFAYKREFLKRFDAAVVDAVNRGAIPLELARHVQQGTLTPELLQDWIKGQLPKGASLEDALAKRYNPNNISDGVRGAMFQVFNGGGGPAGNILLDALNTLEDRLNASNDAKRARYEAELAKIDRKKNRNPKVAEQRRKTVQALYQQTRPDRLEDIVPGHPLWTQMEKDVLDNFTAAHKAAEVVEAADPKIQQAVREQIYHVLVWSAKDGSLKNLKRTLARDIDRRESGFHQYEKQAEITPQENTDRLMALKDRFEAGERLPAKDYKELMDWQNNTPLREMAQQTGVLQTPTTSLDNPDITYQNRASVERNLRDLIFKEGKKPTAIDELRKSPLKGRTSEEYMVALWDAARKDGLSEDGIWQAAGQQRETSQTTPTTPAPQPKPISDNVRDGLEQNIKDYTNLVINEWENIKPDTFNSGLNSTPILISPINRAKLEGLTLPDWAKKANEDISATQKTYMDTVNGLVNRYGVKTIHGLETTAGKDAFLAANREFKKAGDQYLKVVDRWLKEEWPKYNQAVESPTTLDPLADFGVGTRYHGTSQEFELKPGYEYDQSKNLYGPGLYTTDSLDIAQSYQKKGRGGKPAVYEVKWTRQNKPNLLNMENPFPPELQQAITHFFTDESYGASTPPNFDFSKPAKELYSDFKENLIDRFGPELTTYEAQEILYNLADEVFRQAGYDGFSHVGGQKAGKGKVTPHNVAVLFDPRDFDNGNKVTLNKYEEKLPETDQQIAPPAPAPALPETPLDPDFVRAVYNPVVRRLRVEDGYGNILSPSQMRQMLGKWNRTSTFTERGDVFNGPLTPEQRAQYRRDFLATDEFYRQASGNTFRLDLDTFAPVRISDGVSLDELRGRSRPTAIGEPLPQFPPDFPTDPVEVVKTIENYMGPDAYKLFAQMKREGDQAGIDMAYSDIARAMGFPDPTEVRTGTDKMGKETDQAREYLKMLADDASQRKLEGANALDQYQAGEVGNQKQAEDLARQIMAARSKIMGEAGRGAYDKIEQTYFDYQNKNVLDQMVGSVLPFGYWGRRNFAYIAKYAAAHPAQYAAILNFYKNVEEQNRNEGGIPDYALGNLLLWKNPDGSKVLWNFGSALPFNPVGDSDSMLQLVGPDDDSKTANKTPLAMLFGADRKNGKGEVTGRDKGILSTFLRPNPVIDILTKTGKVNEIMNDLGWVTDGFGSPDPSDKRGERMTAGLIPGRTQIRDISARLGATQWLRTELGKVGIKLNDLDLEGPLNSILFGANAGKPLTAVTNELTEMAQGDPKNKEQYLMALARLKQGNWDPAALKALDTVEAQTAWQRAASLAGFSSVIANTPREQLAGQLYGGFGQVAGQNGRYEVTATDPKTGYQTRTFIPGESSKFFDNNAGANVLFAKNKTSDQIIEGVGNDKTREEVDKIYKAYDEGKFDLRHRNQLLDDLRRGNPTYFRTGKDKDYQQAKGEIDYLPGEEHLTEKQVDDKYFKSENPNERAYAEWKDDLFRAGGERYQQLTDQISKLYDQKRNKEAYALSQTPEYLAIKKKRDALSTVHADFAARYKAENEAKYGPSKSSTSNSSGSTSGGSSTSSSNRSGSTSSGYTAKKVTTSYAKNTSTSSAKFYNTGNNKSGISSSNNGKKVTVTSPGYVNPFKLPITDTRNPFSIPGKSSTAPAAAGSRTSYNGTAYPTRNSAPATPARPTIAPAGASGGEWDANQKRAYAEQIAKGKAKSYAAKVANNYYAKKPWES